jgi:hypothetical protein
MTLWAMCCVRGPLWSTGRSFVQGPMASQSHSTCLAQRSLVRRQVQLEVREPEIAEEALVQDLRVLTSKGQPGA